MASTLGFTGMDNATQAQLTQDFLQAISRQGLDLDIVQGTEADIVVVDMDSLYGPMSWMQLHSAGRRVIGYTSSARSQTDFRLGRDFGPADMDALLASLGVGGRTAPQAAAPVVPEPAAVPHGFTAAPTPQDVLVEATPAPVAVIAPEPVSPAAAIGTPAQVAPIPAPAPEPVAAREPRLADWLQPGRLPFRARFQRGEGPALFVDGAGGEYHGPAVLKPLEGYFDAPVAEADFTPMDDAEWQRDAMAAGAAQPLSRLRWYAGLLEGHGQLLPHLDVEGRYQLTKWLQTEREFPKHFRISTAMMKGPASVPEIAQAANVSDAEVADFVNAGLATGMVQQVLPEPPPSAEPARGGLFGRKTGR